MPTLVCHVDPGLDRYDLAHDRDGVRTIYALAHVPALTHGLDALRSQLRREASSGGATTVYIARVNGHHEFVPLWAADLVVLAHYPPVNPEARS